MGRRTFVRIDEDGEPGCMWGMLQLLDYHHWRGVNRILHRSSRKGRVKVNKWNRKLNYPEQIGRHEESSDAELNEVKTGDSKSEWRKRSKTATMKALTGEEISIGKDAQPRASQFPNKRSLLQNLHLKSSNHGVEDRTVGWSELVAKLQELLHLLKPHLSLVDSKEEPSIVKGEPSEALSDHMPFNYSELKRCLTYKDFKENLDVLDIFKTNKELFLQILHDTDAGLPSQLLSRDKVSPKSIRLFKSGSFPSANSSHPRFQAPSKLEHKLKEVWPLSNIKKLASTPEDNESSQLDAKDSSRSNNFENNQIRRIRRSASLVESMDRYAQLVSHSFDKEMTRRLSRSLKVSYDREFASEEYVPKSFTRRLSIPDLDSYSFLPSEASRDASSAEILMSNILEDPRRTNVSCESHYEVVRSCESTEDSILQGSVEDHTRSRGAEESIDAMTEAQVLTMLASEEEEYSSLKRGDLCTYHTKISIQQYDLDKMRDSVPEKIEDKSVPTLEGTYSEPGFVPNDYPDSKSMLHGNLIEDSTMLLPATSSPGYEDNVVIHEKLSHINKGDILDADFHFVKHILELSGFMSKDQPQTCLLLQQQLDPELFEEAEVGFSPEPKCSSKAGASNSCYRKLVFDLVDQALFDIFERSCTYYPKALSSRCRVHQVPTGVDVLEEVWASVRGHLRWRLDLNPSLDGIVARDLSRNKSWMSLQFESECIALQMEDLIFYELLDEVIG
ncbi:hypothetical protein Dimus_026679 [Dionaea muscipula]